VGTVTRHLFILFGVLDLFILVEMVLLNSLQALLVRHRFVIEIPLELGEGSGVLLTLNFLDSQLLLPK
jgi:hypothetical protein